MLYQRYQPQFHRLHRLWDVLPVLTAEEQDYVGVFIPGTLLSQPSDVDVAETIRWTMRRDRYLIAICHGPEVILTLAQGDSPQRRDVLAASPIAPTGKRQRSAICRASCRGFSESSYRRWA